MSKYYYLISGLPSVSLDDTKKIYSVSEFRQEIEPELSSANDRKLVRWIFMKYDNNNMIAHLRKTIGYVFDKRGLLTESQLNDICEAARDDDKIPDGISVPAYFEKFLCDYYSHIEENGSGTVLSSDDRLSAMYYSDAMKCGNEFLKSWFELNLNIGNLMIALNCRKYGLEKTDYIIGDNEVAEQLRQSNSRDFGIGESLDYMDEIQHITEEQDLMVREKRLDTVRWNWLEENTFFKTFDIESVIAYLLRLSMIERWVELDKVSGERTFRELVSAMKKESTETLEEFKKKNNK